MGLPLKATQKLQLIQNAVARMILSAPRFTHVAPLLCELHWLPASFRVQFKMPAITFKLLHGMAPGYLWDFMCVSAHPTRSDRVNMLQVPSLKSSS